MLLIYWTPTGWVADFSDTADAPYIGKLFQSEPVLPLPLTERATIKDVLDLIAERNILPELDISVEVV